MGAIEYFDILDWTIIAGYTVVIVSVIIYNVEKWTAKRKGNV